MLLAALIAIGAVGLGLALGLVQMGRARLAGPLRTFALSAALTVVMLHLLPEAFAELGVTALFLFAATSVFSAWQRLVNGVFRKPHDDGDGHAHGGLVAGYVGLLVHHVGDGLGLGAYAALPGGPMGHVDVMLALGAHTVPLVAVVAYAFQRTGGARGALRAAAGLAGASVLGVLLSSVAPSVAVERYSAWIAALVAGLLVHVVTHDLGRDLPTNLGSRALDAVLAIGGVAACLIGGAQALGGHAEAIVMALFHMAETLSLPLLLGAAVVTLATAGTPGKFRRLLEAAFGRTLGIDGLVLAVLACGVVEGLLLTVGGLAVVGLVAAVSKRHPEPAVEPPVTPDEPTPWLIRLDDVVSDSVAWIAAALACGALIAGSATHLTLDAVPVPLAIALTALVALPVRLPAAPALIIALALQSDGLCFPAVLVFAVLAPAPGATELSALARRAGTRTALVFAAALVASIAGLATLASLGQSTFISLMNPLFPGLKARVAALILGAIAVRAGFIRGLRGLLLEVFPSHDTASHVPTATDPAAAPEHSHPTEHSHAEEHASATSGEGG